MPDKLRIDDSNYMRNLERAEKLLAERAPWWDHREASDPGVTLVELWALLADMQSYYMDQVQESHYRKYLKLLGVQRDEGSMAEAWVSMENVRRELVLPKGTRLLADNMVFETSQTNLLTPARITGFYLTEDGENLAESLELERKGRFPLIGSSGLLFQLELSGPVGKSGLLELFVLLDEKIGRTPPEEPGFCLAGLVWESRSGKKWRPAAVLRDDTCGLLRSGKIILRLGESVKSENGILRLRCRISEGDFDMLPTVYKLMLNVVRVRQQDTLCESLQFSWNGEESLLMPDYLSSTGLLEVYIGGQGGRWEKDTALCSITPPVERGMDKRYVRFKRELYEKLSQAGGGVAVRIICRRPEFCGEPFSRNMTGVSTQKISLPWKNIYRPSLGVQVRERDESCIFREYACAEPEDCGKYLFHWQDEENILVFGDGRHGDIPEAAADGFCISALCLWEGENGNTAYGRINRLESPELFDGITCCNYLAASGGRNRKTAKAQFESLAGLWKPGGRAVTLEDYAELAKSTPGLIIREVQAEDRGKGRIFLKIGVQADVDNQWVMDKYKEALNRRLNRFRMAADRIELELYFAY